MMRYADKAAFHQKFVVFLWIINALITKCDLGITLVFLKVLNLKATGRLNLMLA